MARRYILVLPSSLFPLQSSFAVFVDYFGHGLELDQAERLLFHTHDNATDTVDHDRDDHVGRTNDDGGFHHDGDFGHSHSPHIQHVVGFIAPVVPTLNGGVPLAPPYHYASAIPKPLDRPPLDARR